MNILICHKPPIEINYGFEATVDAYFRYVEEDE